MVELADTPLSKGGDFGHGGSTPPLCISFEYVTSDTREDNALKHFTFRFRTGQDGGGFHHKFVLLADSHDQAVQTLTESEPFSRMLEYFPLSATDRSQIEQGLKSPVIEQEVLLLDWIIFTDEEMP